MVYACQYWYINIFVACPLVMSICSVIAKCDTEWHLSRSRQSSGVQISVLHAQLQAEIMKFWNEFIKACM